MPTINKFLKNPKTGQIVRWNPFLAKRTDLFACPPPWEKKAESEDDGYVKVSGVTDPDQAPPKIPGMPDPGDSTKPETGQDLATKKAEGEALVKEWFGRGVPNVSKDDLAEFATEKGLAGIDGTKLEMVFQIKEGLENQGE